MKNITTAYTESIVFIVEDQATRRMLNMYLAAAGLDARTYASNEDYLAWHDTSRIQYLVLDMQMPGMDGAILQRQNVTDGENAENFKLIPIQCRESGKSSRFARFASETSDALVVDSVGDRFLNRGEI